MFRWQSFSTCQKYHLKVAEKYFLGCEKEKNNLFHTAKIPVCFLFIFEGILQWIETQQVWERGGECVMPYRLLFFTT